ncbi:hypothetical protein Tco_1346646, partial [Tanacetum coccineum]
MSWLLVYGYLKVLYRIDDEQLVLHKSVVVEEVNKIVVVEEMLRTMECILTDDYCRLEIQRSDSVRNLVTSSRLLLPKTIAWNDPLVIRYHSLKMKPKTIAQARRNMIKYLKNQGNFKISHFKGMSYNDIRPIFEKIWDFNQNIEPMDAKKGSKKQKSPEKERSKSPEKERSPEKIVEEKVVTQEEKEEVVKEPGTKRKKSIPR